MDLWFQGLDHPAPEPTWDYSGLLGITWVYLHDFFATKNFEFGLGIYIQSGHRERAANHGFDTQFVVWLKDL